jgi:hypothetical protein
MKLHFWWRVGGNHFFEVKNPRPLAKLDDGRIVKFHISGRDRKETEDILRHGVFKWRYLGMGVIHAVENVAQYPYPKNTLTGSTRKTSHGSGRLFH